MLIFWLIAIKIKNDIKALGIIKLKTGKYFIQARMWTNEKSDLNLITKDKLKILMTRNTNFKNLFINILINIKYL